MCWLWETYYQRLTGVQAIDPAASRRPRHSAPENVNTVSVRFASRFGDGVRTPEAVEGRQHGGVQTDRLIVELSDHYPAAAGATQTSTAMDRPSSPTFHPAKRGVDCATQVEPREAALFDFDAEVSPVVDALVVNTLECAIMEVHEDAELEAIRQQQVRSDNVRVLLMWYEGEGADTMRSRQALTCFRSGRTRAAYLPTLNAKQYNTQHTTYKTNHTTRTTTPPSSPARAQVLHSCLHTHDHTHTGAPITCHPG